MVRSDNGSEINKCGKYRLEMRLAKEAVSELLHVIEEYSRITGVPYNYYDLEDRLNAINFEIKDDQVVIPKAE